MPTLLIKTISITSPGSSAKSLRSYPTVNKFATTVLFGFAVSILKG